jgi:hypothetical protein
MFRRHYPQASKHLSAKETSPYLVDIHDALSSEFEKLYITVPQDRGPHRQ